MFKLIIGFVMLCVSSVSFGDSLTCSKPSWFQASLIQNNNSFIFIVNGEQWVFNKSNDMYETDIGDGTKAELIIGNEFWSDGSLFVVIQRKYEVSNNMSIAIEQAKHNLLAFCELH